ncbi:MAG: PKD domain-containing protein [Flavobacteriales bacterium]|nr:PKD domain-containing protein [Flavobacteriales bacterium]NCA20139.1 PKD domain-containing protein [Crocinitomicaceae bacterium]
MTMKYFFYIFLFFISFSANASHIIGGDIYYDYLGNNQYRFFITLYRDCNSTGAAYDNPLQLAIYKANGQLFQNIEVPFPGSVVLPINFNNPCATPPTNICVERAIYSIVVTLPPMQGGYNVAYQRCCRGPNVTNLISPDDTGLTLTTHVPGGETGFTNNSSPRFTNYPPVLLCSNDQLVFNHVATDPDGDQLVYSLVTPNSGASSASPLPAQTPPPPYFPVQWAGTFTSQQPLGPGSSTIINSTTGVLTVNPNMIGLFVVGVRVQEYRNGVLVGETVRDFLFRVFDCNITLQAILPLQTQLPTFVSYCQGLTVNFVNNSYGGSNYQWDFGIANSTSDVSSTFAPSFTYPAPGTYQAQLVVNPGLACTDTAYMTITVNNPFSMSWTSQDSLCILGNSFDFITQTSNPAANFSWVFDSDASVQTSTNLTVPDVTFSTAGYHVVTLNGDDGDCVTSYTDSIYIFDLPISAIGVPPNVQCLGYTVAFENNSMNAYNYAWDFGVQESGQDVSTDFEPTYTYTNPGNYTIKLIASSSVGCSDTSTTQIQIYEPLVMSFVHSDSLCISNGGYDFDATVSGPASTVYTWNFGSNANPSTSNQLDVFGVQYFSPGLQSVTLTGVFDVCTLSISSTVFVYGVPQIDFLFVNTLQCAPSNAQFVNLSQTDAPTSYFWDFGDGYTSTEFNPNHSYTSVGNYSVSLSMTTLAGCVDTLFLMKQDLVTVHPKPTAGFMVTPNEVDICNSTVEFIDQSVGANAYFYFFDRNQFISTNPSFFHNYTTAGSDYPMQVVENQFGCRDSTRRTVFVEPFVFYIPNTFVPDDNVVNDIFKVVSAFEIEALEFTIYDKWGERIFFSEDLNYGWDGTYRGKPCQDDTYIYTFKYIGCDSPYEWKLVEGFVNLLR